jgi:wobble nucleotide-excising tRNase
VIDGKEKVTRNKTLDIILKELEEIKTILYSVDKKVTEHTVRISRLEDFEKETRSNRNLTITALITAVLSFVTSFVMYVLSKIK